MLYSFIFSFYILVRMIDAADPEKLILKLIFQKALLLALDKKTTLLLKQDQIMAHILISLSVLGLSFIFFMWYFNTYDYFGCSFRDEGIYFRG